MIALANGVLPALFRGLVRALLQGIRAMAAGPRMQLAAIGAITACLVLVGVALLVSFNVDRLTASWGRGTPLTIYLQAGIPNARVEQLAEVLERHQSVAAVRFIGARQAHELLEKRLGKDKELLADLEQDFLPPSFEVRLKPAAKKRETTPLLGFLRSAKGVQEVDDLGLWAARMGSLVALLRAVGLAIALLVALVCLYVVATTIRMGVHGRRTEVEIQKLVGATPGFVRAPFMVEGLVQGLLGGGCAGFLLYLVFRTLAPQIEASLVPVVGQAELWFLSPVQLIAGIGLAGSIGLCGSYLALGRYVEV